MDVNMKEKEQILRLENRVKSRQQVMVTFAWCGGQTFVYFMN